MTEASTNHGQIITKLVRRDLYNMTTRFDFFVYSKKETSCFFIRKVNAVIFIEEG